MKTIINEIIKDWKRVKNHCRTTVNKGFTEKEPDEYFKRRLLISEHSPIRLLEVDWSGRESSIGFQLNGRGTNLKNSLPVSGTTGRTTTTGTSYRKVHYNFWKVELLGIERVSYC